MFTRKSAGGAPSPSPVRQPAAVAAARRGHDSDEDDKYHGRNRGARVLTPLTCGGVAMLALVVLGAHFLLSHGAASRDPSPLVSRLGSVAHKVGDRLKGRRHSAHAVGEDDGLFSGGSMGASGGGGWSLLGGGDGAGGGGDDDDSAITRQLAALQASLAELHQVAGAVSGAGKGSAGKGGVAKAGAAPKTTTSAVDYVSGWVAAEQARRKGARLLRRAMAAVAAASGLVDTSGAGAPWADAPGGDEAAVQWASKRDAAYDAAGDSAATASPSPAKSPGGGSKASPSPTWTPGRGVAIQAGGPLAGGAAGGGVLPGIVAGARQQVPGGGGGASGGGGGGKEAPLDGEAVSAAAGCAGPHEADVLYPEPSAASCRMLQDAFDVCSYESVCFDLPGPLRPDNRDDPPVLWFVGSDALGGRFAGSGLPYTDVGRFDRETTYFTGGSGGGGGTGGAAAGAAAPGGKAAGAAATAAAALSAADSDRTCRHRTRLVPPGTPSPDDKDILSLAANHERGIFDVVFVDVTESSVTTRPRVLPWASFMRSGALPPSDTVSAAQGGTFNGTVTWVDSLWVGMTMINAHLWSFGANVAFPLFGASLANSSMGLGLPPPDNFLVYNTEGWKEGRLDLPSPFDWHGGNEGKWAQGFLGHLLTYLHPARRRPFNGKVPPSKGGRYAAVEAVLARAYADAVAAGAAPALPPGQALPEFNASDTSGSFGGVFDALLPFLPAQLPWEWLTLANDPSLGSRILWNINDVPLPPWPYAAAEAAAGRRPVDLRRRRLCAKHAVVVGEKPMLVSGPAEATAIREFGYEQLGVPRPPYNPLALPPRRIAVIDRGRSGHAASDFKPRGFANVPAILRVLDKYNLTYDVLTDKNLTRLDFAGQARAFSQYGLVVMAHGAGETNFAFLPPRAAVIEVSPTLMWCPLYIKYLSGLGHNVYPIFSRLKGPLLEWNVWEGPTANMSVRLAMASKCDRNSLPNIARHACWHEAKMAAVQVPIHEFEHVLLRALDVMGVKLFPIDSAFDLIEGLPSGVPDVPFWTEGHYESVGWYACPPDGAGGVDASRCVR